MHYGPPPKDEKIRRLSERRRNRRAQGLCAQFGCNVVTGDEAYRCPEHAEAQRKKTEECRARKALARKIELARQAGT